MAHHSITRHGRQSPFPTSGSDLPDFLFYRGEFAHRSLEDPPRLVLLGLKLSRMDGPEVLRTVKRDPCTKAIPVVVPTASREERHWVGSYRLGSNGNIQNPLEFHVFCQVVKQLGLYWLVVNEPPPNAFRP
jgi:CheY-like chemotaxis protein